MQEKQSADLTQLKQKLEEFTRAMISENFDKLLKESEEIKEKLEEWRASFDVEQKKRFQDQEKKISKKIDLKISDLATVMDRKLQAHHEQNEAIAKKNKEFMKESFACIFAAMTNIQETTNGHSNQIGSLQYYAHKENGKHQKHRADDN
eukprot:1345034-Ditylum_brightwellii.AAC.1